jgi:cell division protein FtsL
LAIALPRPQYAPLGPRLVAFASTLPDRSVVERMIRGRVWIGVLAFLLIGLVAMQVSLLKLNAGIGGAVERSSALERANGELRAQVSQLQSGERIQEGAAALGMVMPPAGQISYLRSGHDVGNAAAALREGRFTDSSHVIPLPGTGEPPDPLAAALAGGGMTEDGTTQDEAASGETGTGDETASGDGTSAGDGTSSGDGTPSGDQASSGEAASGDGSSAEADAAAAGGTTSGQ